MRLVLIGLILFLAGTGIGWHAALTVERGVAPDVRLGRQDGRVLGELLDTSGPPARRRPNLRTVA